MLQRMLIDKMENRILVGITMFVGIMILFGWVAINENARMASFERQFEARAIERGAEKYAANCSTCHGEDGLGIGGRAPALNSPHFFGYDFFAEINLELDALNKLENELMAERSAISEELVAEGTSDERKAEIQERIVEITEAISGEGGIEAQREALQAEKLVIAEQLEPATLAGYPLEIAEDGTVNVQPSRLNQTGWGGTLDQYIITTLIHGRPTSVGYWPAPMVAWSQRAGGPLRDDQISDISTFIQNWDKGSDWTIEDALLVQQYGIIPGLGGGGDSDAPPAVGVDVAAAEAELASLTGDPVRGEALYYSQERPELGGAVLGCSGCHVGGANGPALEGTWTRVLNERLTVDRFTDYTAEAYVIESIVLPGDYTVPGWEGVAMPGNFGERLSAQDLADLVAFIATQTDG